MSGLAGELRAILRVIAWVAAILAVALVVGWVCELVRFAAAQLPAVDGADSLSVSQLIGHGVLWGVEAIAVGTLAAVLSWLAARRKWTDHKDRWKAIVQPPSASGRGRSPRQTDDWAVQIVAGFNILIVAGLLAVGAGRLASLLPIKPWQNVAGWIAIAVGLVVLVLAWLLVTQFGPLWLRWLEPTDPEAAPGPGPGPGPGPEPEPEPDGSPRRKVRRLRSRHLHVAMWVLVGLSSLFASAPVGVLLLTGAILASSGTALSRQPRPRSLSHLVHLRLVWGLLGVALLLAVAYNAMGPLAFPRVVVTTADSELTGGFVSRSGAGVDIVTCTALADATSTDARLQLVPSDDVRAVLVGGAAAYFDSGARPSLARLVLQAAGIGAHPPTLFTAALRSPQPTCAGTGPAATPPGVADPQLGAGVVAGPAPAHGQAVNGETPIGPDAYLTPAMAALAKRYQPTMLVTAADRNWPVSVNTVLAERGRNGQSVCLYPPLGSHGGPTCPARAGNLTSQPTGYLQLPATLGSHPGPDAQFRAFLAGLGETLPPRRQWLGNPSSLDPWASAQLYFYYAPGIPLSAWPKKATVPPTVANGLVALEYWFFYPFNYYPTVINAGLMDQAPVAGDRANVDLHQGDWEHVDVLLDPKTKKPQWLYLARHDFEGAFVPWNSSAMTFDDGHPVIQAAFGGHPSYLPGCGPGPRAVAYDVTADWLSCGSGRFAFRAATTPLVDTQIQPWACWQGFFGQNGSLEAKAKGKGDYLASLQHVVFATPPRGPLVQAENTGVCQNGQPTGLP